MLRTPQAERPAGGTTASIAHGDGTAIRYLGDSPIRVRGLATGRSYEFSLALTVQSVDARDAVSLLGTRFFRRA